MGTFSSCHDAQISPLGIGWSLEECHLECFKDEGCHYFLNDPNDGDCALITNISAGECKKPYEFHPWFSLYTARNSRRLIAEYA